uniref:Uncharacterized protein n=1 Tax=Manihot esculenta TaxID=3983 RepID=A0A2C9WQ68_MANES
MIGIRYNAIHSNRLYTSKQSLIFSFLNKISSVEQSIT